VPEILDRRVDSLSQYFDVTRELGDASARRRLWFRGVHDAGYALVPRLYRSDADAAQLLELERDMLDEFRTRSRPLLSAEITTDWEYLFVMQHYGVPTRLLDWSENAFFALYFALSAAADREFTTDAAIWVLDPAGWNGVMFPDMRQTGAAVCVGDPALDGYEPGHEPDQMAAGAAAMWALYNNPRIAAQRGVFTVLGSGKDPLQDLFEERGFAATTLCRIRLPREILDDLNEQVRLLGFRESMIYPDLGGLATEVRLGHGLR
jgi:hypothetical protein